MSGGKNNATKIVCTLEIVGIQIVRYLRNFREQTHLNVFVVVIENDIYRKNTSVYLEFTENCASFYLVFGFLLNAFTSKQTQT